MMEALLEAQGKISSLRLVRAKLIRMILRVFWKTMDAQCSSLTS